MNQRNLNFPYEDIIHLPRPEYGNRRKMPISDRAAQFLPFAALTGYEAAVKETERLTEAEIELDENCKDLLDEKLMRLKASQDQHPQVMITYFQPDEKKAGGAYLTVAGEMKRLDAYERCIIMKDGIRIPLDRILDIGS